jgi:hypothetical protein
MLPTTATVYRSKFGSGRRQRGFKRACVIYAGAAGGPRNLPAIRDNSFAMKEGSYENRGNRLAAFLAGAE